MPARVHLPSLGEGLTMASRKYLAGSRVCAETVAVSVAIHPSTLSRPLRQGKHVLLTPFRSICLFSLVTTAALAPTALRAQERPDTARLTPVVVTATRVPGRQAAPATTATLLDGDMLRARGIGRVADALREVPGLSVVAAGSQGAVTSVFLRGGESDYVQVLIDGIIVNEPGGAVDFANLTTDDIDRIEIVRGPTSVLYGSEAVSGVIQIFTRQGSGAPRVSLSARAGSRRAREVEAGLRGGNSRLVYTLGAARTASDGILPFNNQYRGTTLTGAVGTVPGAAAGLRLTARASDGRYHFPTDFSGEAVDSNQFSFERRVVVGIDGSHPLGARRTARLSLTSSLVDAGTDDAPDSPSDTSGSYSSRSTRESARHGADLRIDHELRGSTITTGADLDWERQQTGFSSEHGTFGPYRAADRDDRRWNRGYYAQVLGDALSVLSYTAGARLDDNETFGTFATYRAGAGLRLPSGTLLRAAAGTGFKSPVFYEATGAGFAEPNDAIQPERSRSWDAGVEQSLAPFGREITVGITYFEQRFRDMIQYIPNAADPFGLGQYRNIAGARASGVELESRALVTSRLTILANATMLDTRVLEAQEGGELAFQPGDQLIRRPRVSAHAGATLRVGNGVVGASVNHVGNRDDIDFVNAERLRLPSHTTVNASLELPVLPIGRLPSLAVRARVENLLDADYEAIAGFPAPGRTVLIGLSAAFGP